MTDFVHLHQHTEYSLLDGMSRPEEIAEIVARNGQIASAITDHGTMSGTLRFQKACEKQGIKSIHGVEAYYVPSLVLDDADKKAERFHLILLAKNDEGLEQLFKLQQKSWINGFYYKPRTEWDDLEYLAGNVVCLSGCMASLLCRLLERGMENEAWDTARRFRQIFGQDYYIELQPWNYDGLNVQLMSIAAGLGISLVGTIDCHYPHLADKGNEEALLMMGQMPSLGAAMKRYAKEHASEALKNPMLLDQINVMYPDRKLRFDAHSNYVMSSDEVRRHFEEVGITNDVYSATLEIADKCTSKIKTGRSLLPTFSKKFDSEIYLREIAELGLRELGLWDNEEYRERLDEELSVINKLNFCDYFLIVWDICAYADREGIARGPGRGSVGGSLLAYVLGITKVDPLRWGLLFTRFINAERVSWPDIDMDFEDKRRDEIKEYIKQRWGAENVASISTFGEFKSKSVIKAAGNLFQVDYNYMNKLTAKFETISDLKHINEGREFFSKYPNILNVAERLENRIRTAGAHAAGVVISSEPLWKVCPIETRAEKGEDDRLKVIAYDMEEAENLGLIKFDILGLKALAVINDCIKKIKERYNIDVDNDTYSLDDADVIDRFNTDSLVGVFQVEGAGYKSLISDMGIDSFDDLVASNALVRPGAFITQGAQYVGCKRGVREVEYPHDVLEPILKDTFGTIVYQEQVMLMAQAFGFTGFEADTLRKIIGKKRDAAEFLPFRDKFIEGATQFVSKEKAEKLWEDLELTATYQFPKAHAVEYSMISYQTMWLKHYYPLEFIWACLTNEQRNEDISGFLVEAGRLNIDVLPPDINSSGANFTLVGNTIRFGLSNVSGCGPAAIKEVLKKRPFNSFQEFREKCSKSAVRSNLVENLEKIGAFSEIGHDSGYDQKKYYLPILNWSKYAEEDSSLSSVLSRVAKVGENNGIHFIRAVVKSTSRKPHYFRVEFEDSTGAASFFAEDKEASIRSKDYLIAIVGAKNLIAFADASDDDSNVMKLARKIESGETEDWGFGIGEFGSGKYKATVISSRWFKTKNSGAIMANAWVYEPMSRTFQRVTIFPKTYSQVSKYLTQWRDVVIINGDKPDIVNDMISWEEFKKLKGI
jgi:DNA polymerase III subunit alpha